MWLAREHGIRSVLLDHCGTGGSACVYDDFHDDRPGQLIKAVDWARTHGARRLVLVGASLGGVTAVIAAARLGSAVDAVVDLSSPLRWPGYDLVKLARRITAPALLALARWDDVASFGDYQRLLGAFGSKTKRFIRIKGAAHGWDMLGKQTPQGFVPTPLGETVAAWVKGDDAGG